MDELYRKLAFGESLNLWGNSTSSDETAFEVTEGWLNHASGKVKHTTRVIDSKNMESWLAQESVGTGKETKSLIMRLAWVNVHVADKRILLADSVQQVLIKKFGLELAHGYARSCINNVSAIPPSKEQCDLRSYAFCYVPKIASVWSHVRFDTKDATGRPFLTQGLIFVQQEEKETLSKLLESPWNVHIYSTAMMLPLLFCLLLLSGIHLTDTSIKKEVRNMERHKGHHIFKSIDHDATESATAELGRLSARANGCAAKLASTGRKSKMVENLLTFITRNLDEGDKADRLAMLNVDTDYTLKRIQVQNSALAGIISHNESLANISLSRSQNELAHHSYRESLSMKWLAIATMFFLPRSFISALFSTQLFDWDSVKPGSSSLRVRTTPQFTLYWTITVPLTMVVFFLYLYWDLLVLKLWDPMRPRRQAAVLDSDSVSSLEKGGRAGLSHASTTL